MEGAKTFVKRFIFSVVGLVVIPHKSSTKPFFFIIIFALGIFFFTFYKLGFNIYIMQRKSSWPNGQFILDSKFFIADKKNIYILSTSNR